MTSTETTTTTKTSTAIATSGRSSNIEDIYDENLLREMWQDMDDMDAKRQIRSRMYKLREERLKEFYGREGQDILENILKPVSDEGIQASSSSSSTMEGKRERTVVTTESRTIGGDEVVESRTVHAKQTVSTVLQPDGENVISTIVTTTTTTAGGDDDKDDEQDEETNTRKFRIINKERTGQMQEIKNQQRSSGRRNVSTSEITKPLSKRGSMDSDISVGRATTTGAQNNNNQMKNKNMTNGVVSKRKQTTTTVTTSGGGESGEGNVSETGATLSTAVVSTASKGEKNESAAADEGFGNRSVAALRKNFQQADFSTMSTSSSSRTMSSMSSTSVHLTSSSSVSTRAIRESSSSSMMSHPESGQSSTRVLSSMRTVTTSETGGMPLSSDVNITQIENQLGGPPNEKLDVGKVLIKEIGGGGAGMATAVGNEMRFTASSAQSQQSSSSRSSQFRSSSPITSRGDRCSKPTRQNSKGGDANLINGNSGDVANRSTIRTNSSSSITTRAARKSNTETNEKMSSQTSANTTRSSSSSRNPSDSSPTTKTTTTTTPRSRSPSHPKHSTGLVGGRSGGTSSEVVEEKVCRRANKLSGESSPKNRTSRRQLPSDNLKQQQPERSSSSSSPTKTTTRTSSKTRITEKHQQQPRQPPPGKKETSPSNLKPGLTKAEPDKTTKSTEEKIMRELDSLDTFLSQRSASIDEGNREESTPPGNTSPAMAKMNGAHGGVEERLVKRNDKNFSVGKATRNVLTSISSTTTTNKEVDVMESGVEAPFTRTTYKYNCPEDNHRHHHTPDHSPDKLPEKNPDLGKRSPKKGTVGTRAGAVTDKKSDLEDQIITSSHVAPKAGDHNPKSTSSHKPDALAKTEKSTRGKRPLSQSPDKPRKPTTTSPMKTRAEPSKREGRESTISQARASTTTTTTQSSMTNTNQSELKSSPGKKAVSSSPIQKTSPVSNAPLKKKNVQELSSKKTDEVIANISTTTHNVSISRQERKVVNTQGMTEVEKYEADILSRPSVFAARRAVSAKGTTTTVPAPEKPEPNQRSRRTPDSSPEREMPSSRRAMPQVSSNASHSSTKASSVTREIFQDTLQVVDELDEDNPLNPPKRFTTSGKGLESPGAVLKAKSLFENKAQEASKDRSSVELGSRVSTSPKLTVFRKAALFEARSRGERVSISSESEHSDGDETGMDSTTNSEITTEKKYKTSKVPEVNERAVSMERRVSEVISVVRKEGRLIEAEETVTTQNVSSLDQKEIKESTNEGIAELSNRSTKFSSARKDSGKLNRTSAHTTRSASISVSSPSKKPDSRSSSPNRHRKSEGNITPRKAPPVPVESPEKPQTPTKESVRRTPSRQKSVENANNNNKRESPERHTPIKKKDSKTKIESKSERSLSSVAGLKRKDSREITTTSSSSKVVEEQPRKALQDIEQKNMENRVKTTSLPSQKGEIISTNQSSTLSELKSANVVMTTMRQSAVYSQEASFSSHFSSTISGDESSSKPNTTITEIITKSPKHYTRASKSPERSDVMSRENSVHIAEIVTNTNSSTKKPIIERRRSSNLEKKVEALMATSNKSSTTRTTPTTPRMTTAELNAVDDIDNIEELEGLLDKAVDYDERSKIRARIRVLKRKATLVKRVSDIGSSPERQVGGDEQRVERSKQNNIVTSSTTATVYSSVKAATTTTVANGEFSTEPRFPKDNKVSSRKSSTELATDRRVSSRKSSDELPRKSPGRVGVIDKENRLENTVETTRTRASSPPKQDRRSPPATTTKRETKTSRGTISKEEEEKYTADILSRPSVFAARRAVAAKEDEQKASPVEKPEKEPPKQRTKEPSPAPTPTRNRDRKSPSPTTTRIRDRKSPSPQRSVGSRSNSGQIVIKRITAETDKPVAPKESQPEEDKRKLSTETTELLSTRSYARDNEKVDKQEVVETMQTVTSSSRVTSKATSSFTAGESVTIQDQDLYSSRRSSRNLEEDKADVEKLRRAMTTTESSSTRVNQKREKSVPKKSRSPSPQSKPSSRAASPQRSEIPISNRMKRERSLSPPKILPKDIPSQVTEVEETSVEIKQVEVQEKFTDIKKVDEKFVRTRKTDDKSVEVKKIDEKPADIKKPDQDNSVTITEILAEQQQQQLNETPEIAPKAASPGPRKFSARKPSSELIPEDRESKQRSMTPERKVKPSRGTAQEEEEKYAADILSRPSVFAARRAVAAKEASPAAEAKPEKVVPKRKSREPSPEKESKDVADTATRTASITQRTITERTKESSARRSPVVREDSSKSLTAKAQPSSQDAPVPEDKETVTKEKETVASKETITTESVIAKEKVTKESVTGREKMIEESVTKKSSRNIPVSRRSSSKEIPKKSNRDEPTPQAADRETSPVKPSDATKDARSIDVKLSKSELSQDTKKSTVSKTASEIEDSKTGESKTSSYVSKHIAMVDNSKAGESKTTSTSSRASNVTTKPVTSFSSTTSNTSSRRSIPSSNKAKVTERTVSTDMVTSSYGVGPTDDNGAPLFGLRALRKIKQVQEQMEASPESQDVEPQQQQESTTLTTTTTVHNTTSSAFSSTQDSSNSSRSITGNLHSLRSNDMYGLRALRKQAQESRAESQETVELNQQSPKPLSTGSSTPLEKDKRSRSSPTKTTTTPGPATSRTATNFTSLSSQNSNSKRASSEDSANNAQTFSINSIEREDDFEEVEAEMEAIISATEIVSETVESSSSSSMMGSNESRKQSSPKSILKKTSSFSSAVRKDSGNGGTWEEQQSSASTEVLHPDDSDTSVEKSSSEVGSSATRSTSKTTSSRRETKSDATSTEQRKISGKMASQDDESWMRQRSHSPSPKPASSSTASSIATFSRGKVGRSSVREMSKRFDETGEQISKSSSSTSLSSDMRSASMDRESSPSIVSRGSRAESPSRIPLSVKSTTVSMSSHGTTPLGTEIEKDITISEENSENSKMRAVTETFQTGGPIRTEDGEGEFRIQGSHQQKRQQRRFETADGSVSVTSNVVTRVVTSSSSTTTSGGRSFLTDQSPIQNLSDVIDRMRGEDPELMKPFSEDNAGESSVVSQGGGDHGRNLLNKFIGAQVIMQAIEPMLIAQKVSMSMSSSLEQKGADVEEADMESPTIKEMIDTCEEVEQSSKEQRVQSSGGSASVEITEISSSSHTPILIQQSSVASESGDQGRSATTTDVTGECELMPLILDQLQSSLSSISSSSPAIGGGGGGGAYGACATLSCHNLMGSQSHHLSHSSSHNNPYGSHNSSDKSNNKVVVVGNNTTSFPELPSSPTVVNSGITYNSNCSSAPPNNNHPSASTNASGSSVGNSEGGLELLREEESSSSTGSSSEECLFDSGTESGEDLSANLSLAPTTTVEDSSTQLAPPQLPTVVTIPCANSSSSVADGSQLSSSHSQYDDVATEFSYFMEGLKNSLKRNSKRGSAPSAYFDHQLSDTSASSFLSQDQLGCSGEGGSTEAGIVAPRLKSQRKFSVPDPTVIDSVGSSSIKSRVEENRAGGGENVCGDLAATGDESGLIQQVDKVLTLLRASLIKDPGVLLAQIPADTDIRACDPSKGKELIALIDRLKSSLNVEEQHQQQQQHDDKEKPFGLNPTSGKAVPVRENNFLEGFASTSGLQNTGQSTTMIGCAQPQYSDIIKSSSNSWIGEFSPPPRNDFLDNSIISPMPAYVDYSVSNNQNIGTMVEHNNNVLSHISNNANPGGNNPAMGNNDEQREGVPWKIRLARRRSQPRSHTVGVTQEELAEARRLFEESTGFRFYAREPAKQPPSIYSNVQDLSSLGNSESVTSTNNNNNINLNNINNYKTGDATVVGTVPAPSNPRLFTSSESEPDNLPLSPTSSVPYPHSSSAQDEVASQNNTSSISSGMDREKEILPSGSGGGGCVSTPNWQTDVEKRLTSIPRPFVPFVKHATQFYEGYQPPPERRMTYASIDDSCPIVGGVIGNLKIKPFRTYSLDNNKSSDSQDDPSKSFFTPQETVQIAIHKAAIKKQMSEEEDRRKRRNSLSSYQAAEAGIRPDRNYALDMPKPYSPPQALKQQQQVVDYNQQPEQNSYDMSSHPSYSTQSNGYSPFYQSGDSGYTEESGPETGVERSLHKGDQTPTNGYDLPPCNNTAPVSTSVLPLTTNNNNTVVNISSTGNSGISTDTIVSSGNTITYTTTPSGNFLQSQQQQQPSSKRIENVQISLKELSSSEFPQLQIAITLNTNNNNNNNNNASSSPEKLTGSDGSLPGKNQQNSLTRVSNASGSNGTSVTAQQQQGNMGNNSRAMPMDMSSSTPYFSNDEGQQISASASRAIRYKSKNERKKRLKRANTIDIPQPPGFILHSNTNDDDDDSEMEDEEDSDCNYRTMKNNGNSVKYQPFMAKTEGDKKFLAFLEKNNALGVSRPLRPSYLGVNDRQWTSRFSNIKTSFESSSQGSSPSASPVPSPLRAPRSVSEMALSHGKQLAASGESFSKPVWANSEKSQLPPQVRNKLHVFENKSFEGQTSDYHPQWRSPHSSSSGYQVGGGGNQYGGNRAMMFPGMKQTVSTNALNQVRGGQPSRIYNRPVYSSHDNVNLQAVSQKKLLFQGNSFDSKLNEQQQRNPMNVVRKPTPMKPHQSFPNVSTEQSNKSDQNKHSKTTNAGVHMVHATAAAMEAMKKSAFVPASVVPVQSVSQSQQPLSGSNAFPPVAKMVQDEKIDLPWAKRSQDLSPSYRADNSSNSSRVHSSKNRFEQPLAQGFPGTFTEAPSAKPVPSHVPQYQPVSQQQQQQPQPYEQYGKMAQDSSNYPPHMASNPTFISGPQPTGSSIINGTQMDSNNAGMLRNSGFSSMGHSAEEFVPVVRPPLKAFGVTQSFDEAFKRTLDQQISSGNLSHPEEDKSQVPFSTSPTKLPYQGSSGSQQDLLSRFENSTKKPFDMQQSSGSAFASSRQVTANNDPVPVTQHSPEKSSMHQPEMMESNSPVPDPDGLVLTPVMSKVMRGPQQQRATVNANRMSTLNDDEENTRLSSARSNLRNFINLYQASSPETTSKDKDNMAAIRPQQQVNTSAHNLSPLIKSASGDMLHISPISPASISPANINISPKEMSRSPIHAQPNTTMSAFNEQPKRPVIIPRQKSLSEFPKIAPPPRIEPLRVETDISLLAEQATNKSNRVNPGLAAVDKLKTKDVIQQQNKTIVQPRFQQQQQKMPVQTSHSLQLQNKSTITIQQQQSHQHQHHHQQHQQQHQRQILQQPQQQIPQATPKTTTRSYPDSLQRTSSGSSIFNRAKNLFFGSQDGAPPSTKLRPKLPTTSSAQAKLPFPKQFEAQMSPDSADRKQRELAAYFRQQAQQQQQEFLQGSGITGVESKAIKSADAVSKSEISSSSISVECEQNEMKASSSLISSSSAVSSSTASSVSASTKVQTVSTSSITMQSQSMTRAALPTTPINKFKAMDQQANAGKKAGAPLFKFANEGLKASATSAKDILLYWCQCRTREYENVKIDNFSSSWSDGLAFCALIHHFYPDAFEYNSLNPRNRKYNFDLAFRIADEKAGIYPLLDTEDMVAMGTRPDWKCVFTYVQSMYQKLKDM